MKKLLRGFMTCLMLGGMTACGQLPSLVSPSLSPTPSLSSEAQELDGLDINTIGDEEMAKISQEFAGTDSLDVFDSELSQVEVNGTTDQLLGQIEKEL